MRLIATAKEWLADAKATERELNEAQARVLQSEIAARSAPPPAAQSASARAKAKRPAVRVHLHVLASHRPLRKRAKLRLRRRNVLQH